LPDCKQGTCRILERNLGFFGLQGTPFKRDNSHRYNGLLSATDAPALADQLPKISIQPSPIADLDHPFYITDIDNAERLNDVPDRRSAMAEC